ncbi:membrane transport protein-domain-containing protein [Cytidiella melzeri]|nr:membrane transport protein-domain-containing protein [Cytidiella melzeri]
MSTESSLLPAFLGALEGSISVLLTLFAGFCIGRMGLLDHASVRRISKVCSSVFLPCLIIEQMGPELTISNISKIWIVPVWGVVSTILSHLLGWLGQVVFKTPHWVIVAAGRPNSSALPLLLLQSLESTGILNHLASSDADSSKLLSRAKSYILLNVVIQQSITFQLAPSILHLDDGPSAHADEELGPASLAPASRKPTGSLNPIVQDRERVGLLDDYDVHAYGANGQREDGNFSAALSAIQDQPDVHWPKRVHFAEKPVKAVMNWISPPLTAAIIALVLGMIPPLHDAFFNKDTALYSSVTQSIENIGELYVATQMFIVGTQIAILPGVKPQFGPTAYSMLVRFLLMPGVSLLFVWATAGRGWYVDDKLVWFLLVLIPSGPSAMLLASVAELANVDQGPIAGYLTVSYMFSPLMAVVCTLGLLVVNNVPQRLS